MTSNPEPAFQGVSKTSDQSHTAAPNAAAADSGYSITAEGDNEGQHGFVLVNCQPDGEASWQCQLYGQDGALVDATYFATEIDALRWAVSGALQLNTVSDD